MKKETRLVVEGPTGIVVVPTNDSNRWFNDENKDIYPVKITLDCEYGPEIFVANVEELRDLIIALEDVERNS